MPLERPTLTELHERIKADLRSHLPGADTELRRGNIQVLSKVHAGATHTLHGFLQRMSLQVMADTAEAEYLERHTAIWGITRKPASKAAGQLEATGVTGSVIPAGTEWERADGARFATDAEATITEGAASLSITASAAGADGDTVEGSQLTLVGYVPGLDQVAEVAESGLSGGADEEADDSLRQRLLTRIQEPPHGGAQTDYEAWALEVPGVTRAYVYPNRTGAGTVGVTVLTDDADGGPIPSSTVIETVREYIDERRPVTADVTVFACSASPVAFDIRLTPDTATVRAAVQAEIEDLFRRESEPEGTLLISHIREAISIAAGEADHTLNSPSADIEAGAGELLTVGTIAWEA